MPSYLNQPVPFKHSPGPPQPKRILLDDTETHAERQRAMAVIAEYGERARRGQFDHLSRRDLLALVYERVRGG